MAVEPTERVTPPQGTPTPPARAPRPEPARPPAPAGGRGPDPWRWLLAIFAVVVVGAVGAWFYFHQGHPTRARADARARRVAAEKAIPRVEVVAPTAGGMVRRTTQPGTIHAFQAADLFAKVSGYL
jgi:hypothetical protein